MSEIFQNFTFGFMATVTQHPAVELVTGFPLLNPIPFSLETLSFR